MNEQEQPSQTRIKMKTIFLCIVIVLTGCNTDRSGYEVFSDVSYLKGRMIASLIAKDAHGFESLEDLQINMKKDDIKLKEFRERGLISQLQSFSDLVKFYSSEKLTSDNNEHWVDYSQQKLLNDIYSVSVSESVCEYLNRGELKKNRLCLEGVYSFNIVEQTLRAYEFKVILRIPDNLGQVKKNDM